jgi:hypothetical protein
MANIGFIGLGIMGAPMALNLQKGGHQLFLYSRSGVKEKALVEVWRCPIPQLARNCLTPAQRTALQSRTIPPWLARSNCWQTTKFRTPDLSLGSSLSIHPLNGTRNVKAMPHGNDGVDRPLTLGEMRAHDTF